MSFPYPSVTILKHFAQGFWSCLPMFPHSVQHVRNVPIQHFYRLIKPIVPWEPIFICPSLNWNQVLQIRADHALFLTS